DRAELHERIKAAYWAALDEATDPEDAEQRLRQVVTSLEQEYPSAAACLAEDLPGPGEHLKYFPACASASAPPTRWSAHSRRSVGAPRSSAASLVRRAASACAGRCSTSSSAALVDWASPISNIDRSSNSGSLAPSAPPTWPR